MNTFNIKVKPRLRSSFYSIFAGARSFLAMVRRLFLLCTRGLLFFAADFLDNNAIQF